jgi:hypothetical protein
MASNEDIIRALSRVETLVEGLSKDVAEEKKDAHESRASLHRRLDEQVAQFSLLDKTVSIEAQINAQTRDRIEDLTRTVRENHDAVAPTIEDMNRLKTLGYGIAGLIALAGVSVGGLVWWAGETAVNTLRHWLKIP